MKKLIYIVEDDPSLRELYNCILETEFDCLCFENGNDLIEAMTNNKPDLIILDIMLPGADGYTILSKLKDSSDERIPVIMVSAKSEELSKVKGLNLGADDYITKPFGVLELVARIKIIFRKTPDKNITSYKNLHVCFSKREVMVENTVVKTSAKEFALISMLIENPEIVQEREDIFEKVWGESFMGETRTLDIHIKEIRKKLTAADCHAKIKTVRSVGFMLT